MPFNAYTDPNNFAVTGSMTIIADPAGGTGTAANLNVAGTVVATGSASFASGVTASSIQASTLSVSGTGTFGSLSAGGLNSSFASGLTVSSGLTYDVITGGLPPSTASSQSLSTGSQINMTSGVSVGGAHVVYVSANSSAATVALTPTSSANTSGVYQNGLEVTVINLAATGSTVVIPSVSAGPNAPLAVTISGGAGKKFVYIAGLQSWIGL